MTDDIKHVPPPWTLKGTIYLLAFWQPKSQADPLPSIAFSPLERSSSYASPENGRPLGGLSMIQIIRYTESPVGPYDELIISPGFQEYTFEDENGKRVKKKNARITRIYVSQKYTCWNGRTNWNIPKHLASFQWSKLDDGTETVKVFPHDVSSDPAEASASSAPLFQASFKPVSYVPSFPASTSIAPYLGLDLTLVHPPLPAGNGSQGELPGTNRWASVFPLQRSRKTCLGWFDMRQGDENLSGEEAHSENFWPGLKRWHLGARMDDAEIGFPEAQYWDPPKSVL